MKMSIPPISKDLPKRMATTKYLHYYRQTTKPVFLKLAPKVCVKMLEFEIFHTKCCSILIENILNGPAAAVEINASRRGIFYNFTN